MYEGMKYLRKYIAIFFTMFGIYYLVNEIETWQELFGDNKIKFAFIMTIIFLVIDMIKNK